MVSYWRKVRLNVTRMGSLSMFGIRSMAWIDIGWIDMEMYP